MTISLVLAALLFDLALCLDNGVGVTPPMGFNDYQSGLVVKDLLAVAKSMDVTGLKDAGYVYVNSDAGWQGRPGRNGSGHPVPDMTWLADELHSHGFQLGLYSALSSVQCGGAPGGLYHEELDAVSYATWTVDFLKYDNCAEYALEPNARNAPMRDALNHTGRRIFYSTEPFHLVPNPQAHLANMWRTTTDISNDLYKIRVNVDLNDKWSEFAGPGAFNDPDMLQLGKGSATVNQQRTHFLLWAAAKSPLLLSTNITTLAADFPELLDLALNEEVIAINQDPLGVQARKLQVDSQPVGRLVGVEECVAADVMAAAADSYEAGQFGSSIEVAAQKQRWSVEPVDSSPTSPVLLRNGFHSDRCLELQNPPNPIAYRPPRTTKPEWSADWQAVLQPCNVSSPAQRWWFQSPGQFPVERATANSRRTLSALINEAANKSLGNASMNNSVGLTLLPETDSSQGVNHVGGKSLKFKDVENPCKDRGCNDYDPSQMWFADAATGQMQSANFTASINYEWLTHQTPGPSRRCLSAVHSADMAGTFGGRDTEVWAGPLANGDMVLVLTNKGREEIEVVADLSLLQETNAFFSFAMLRPLAARAAGFAKAVDPKAASGSASKKPTAYAVRDVLLGKSLGKLTGSIRLAVDKGDAKMLRLTPISGALAAV